MQHLKIDVTGAPEAGFSLVGVASFAFSIMATFMAGTMISIPWLIAEQYQYLFITFGLAFCVWVWWVLIRPRRAAGRVRAYDRSLDQMRDALRQHRGAHRARGLWFGLNVLVAVAAIFCAVRFESVRDVAAILAILLGLNGLRLWLNKSTILKTGLSWLLIFAIWYAAIVLWGLLFADRQDEGDLVATIGAVGLFVLFGSAVWLTRRVAPWSQATMAEMRARDRRAPVLFLRSFEDEAEPILKNGGPGLETVLTAGARPYGPFIAIGRPGELTPAGAARTYFPHDKWQPAALALMDEAAFIVVVPGLTPGLDWEMQRIAERGRLRKTIFVLPPQGRAERIERLRVLLAETPEGARLREVDLGPVLALHLARDWRWVTVCSGYISYAEYLAALDVAVYGLLCADR